MFRKSSVEDLSSSSRTGENLQKVRQVIHETG